MSAVAYLPRRIFRPHRNYFRYIGSTGVEVLLVVDDWWSRKEVLEKGEWLLAEASPYYVESKAFWRRVEEKSGGIRGTRRPQRCFGKG